MQWSNVNKNMKIDMKYQLTGYLINLIHLILCENSVWSFDFPFNIQYFIYLQSGGSNWYAFKAANWYACARIVNQSNLHILLGLNWIISVPTKITTITFLFGLMSNEFYLFFNLFLQFHVVIIINTTLFLLYSSDLFT